MSVFEKRFYVINRTLLSFVGLWPYVDRKEKLIRGFLAQVGVLAGILVQTMRLIISRHNSDLIIEILSHVMTSMIVTVFYCTIYFDENIKQIQIFDSIDNDWKNLKNEEEHQILRKFADETRTIMIALLSITYLHIGLVVPISTYPLILDVINPLNKTRQTKFLPLLEYFSGRERCILKILPIYYLAVLWLGITATATFGWFIVYVQHTCSMFALTGYLITQALNEPSSSGARNVCEDNKVYARIVRAVKCHNRALDFVDRMNCLFEKPTFVAYAIMFMLTIFEITQINNIDLKRASLMAIQIVLLFLVNINGQKIIDYSSSVFESALITRWYLAPVRTQKLFPLIMMRSMKPSYLWIGGLFVLSRETCFYFIKTSVSYAMVLYSLQ